jgi:hypothetical protein
LLRYRRRWEEEPQRRGVLLELIWTLTAVTLVGVVPGWFWARLLSASADLYEDVSYSVALSLALVPAVALIPAQLFGTGVTLAVAAASPLLVFFGGLAAYLQFGPAKASEGPLATPLVRPGAIALVPIILAFALVLGADLVNWRLFWLARSCWGWPWEACVLSGGAQKFLLPVALLLLATGLVYRLAFSREPDARSSHPEREPLGHQGSSAAVLARRLALPGVLLLVLLRGYSGPVLHDWPFIRGVDHYSHAVMTNLMMTRGEIEPYLIYPPGFHTTTAEISRLSGLDPLAIFPVLGPVLLLLPALSCYVLGSRLWGWEVGVVAAFFCGVLVGGTYYYFDDGMYPNLIGSQFLFALTVAALIGIYSLPSIRGGLLLAILGSSVVLYHQVSSLYLALLLVLGAVYLLPVLLARERRMGLTLLASIAFLGALSILYAWDTYNLPQAVAGVVGSSETSTTSTAVQMAIGTQPPYELDYLIGAIVSQPVAWLGLLGAALLVADPRFWTSKPRALAYFTVLLWAVLMFVGSRTSYSGFPQRFGRDLGVPLALLAALALVTIMKSLVKQRRLAAVLAATLVVVLASSLIGLRAAQSFAQASGPSPLLMMTPQIAAAGEWLERHNEGGNIMVSPNGGHVPSRMMLAMGHYSGLQSFPAERIRNPRDIPPTGPKPLRDVLRVLNYPATERTQRLLEEHDVHYVVLYKSLTNRSDTYHWKSFKAHPEFYRVAFENKGVLIVAPRMA